MKLFLPPLIGLFAIASLARAQPLPPELRPDDLQKALAESRTPEARIAAYKELARCQQQASDTEGALKTWRQLIHEFPAETDALDEAGDAMTDAARYADAQSFYEASRDAKGAAPERKAVAIFKLAQLAGIQSDGRKARALHESALQFVPSDGWIAREARLRIEDGILMADAGAIPAAA